MSLAYHMTLHIRRSKPKFKPLRHYDTVLWNDPNRTSHIGPGKAAWHKSCSPNSANESQQHLASLKISLGKFILDCAVYAFQSRAVNPALINVANSNKRNS